MLAEAQARELLLGGQVEFPPLGLEVGSLQPSSGSKSADWELELTWHSQTVRFEVEYIRVASPKNLMTALNQIDRDATRPDRPPPEDGSGPRPMVMAPYFDEDDLSTLIQQGVSGIDFCGNGVVTIPGKWFVYRTGAPNRYPASAPIKRIYEGKSSLVGRVLLARREFSQVTQVKEEIEAREGTISLGTVSKVLKSLEDELIVSRDEGVRLVQPGLLLDKLAENYDRPSDLQLVRGRLPDEAEILERLFLEARELGLRMAVSGAQRYAQLPMSDIVPPVYVESLADLAPRIGFDETSRFSNIEFRETRDLLPYFDRRDEEGRYWTSPVETYLDMSTGSEREQEVAGDLRRRIIEGDLA